MVDVIYIDPPYNTEKTKEEGNDYKEDVESTKFIYRDKFTRDGWLNMMNERLRLARKLLSDKGVIFVSVDDNEQAYLKVLMDEIFGEENYYGCFVQKKGNTQNDSKTIQRNYEYILCYAKNSQPLLLRENKTNSDVKVYDKSYILGTGNGETKFYEKESVLPVQNLLLDFSTSKGTNILSSDNGIVPGCLFKNPKNVDMLKFFFRSYINKNAIILDFFAGSGTTGQAVMELNEEDGGKRKFILVTNNENNIAENVTYERLFRVINGKGTKGEDFQWKYKEDNPYLKDNSLHVFSITKSPLHIDETKKAEEIKEKAIKSFKLINKNYKENDLDIYYALSSLLPYKED